MTAVTGLYWAVGVVLAVAGVAKLRRPVRATLPRPLVRLVPAAHRTSLSRWAAGPMLSRAAGTVELAVGAAAILLGSRWTALFVAATYLLLAATAALMLRTSPGTDCGCFGDTASPLGPGHVAVDGLAAAVAVLAAVTGSVALPAALIDSPTSALLTAALAAGAAAAVVLLLTALPDLTLVRRRVGTVRS